MWYQFTAATERAISYASAWADRNDCDELQAVPLLAGLLVQTECRAATLLAKLAIDLSAVRQRWPQLVDMEADESTPTTPSREGARGKPLSRDVELSLELARQRLAAFPQPLEMATEHVLLGLASADHEVALWLRQHGLNPDRLQADICELYGCQAEAIGDAVPVEPPSAIEKNSRGLTARGDSATAPPNATDQTAVFRILDAAGNRAREALRAIEDYVRFVLDDRQLTELCKQSRHDLTHAICQISPAQRLAARETQADVGVELTTVAEQSRRDSGDVLAANFARLQESLRSLEEFGKVVDAGVAAEFKELRYLTYTVQRAIETTRSSIERLAQARLYVLFDGRQSSEALEKLALTLITAGVDVLQLRDKRLSDRELIERARLLRRLTDGTGTLFVLNDRPDLAALAHADGVHLGQDELSVKDARSIVGPDMLIGVSTHTIEQVRQAVLDGANYIGVGPTFPSATKSFSAFPGVELLRQAASETRLPAFAIGGITQKNVAEVLAAGFTRIAVSGAVAAAADPAQAARELREFLDQNRHGGTENTEKNTMPKDEN